MTVANPPLPLETPSRPLLRAFVRHALWPLLAGLVLATMLWGDARGLQDASRAGLSFLCLALVLLIEQLVPRPGREGIRGDPQLGQDLTLLALQAVTEALTYTALVAGAVWAGAQLHVATGLSLWPGHWAWPAQALLAFLAVDFLDYWMHRASHRVPWLWSIHVHHHDTERLHMLKGTRNHPFAGLVRVVGAYLPLLVLGAPPVLLFWYAAYIVSLATVAHANLDMRFPRWLHRVVTTPPVHRVHHARARSLHDRNFAAFTPVWDLLFGTYEAPEAHPDPDLGVGSARVPGGGLLRRLAWPFVYRRYPAR